MPTPEHIDQVERAFCKKYQSEAAALARFNGLDKTKLGSGAVANLNLLATLQTDGIVKTRGRRKTIEGQEEVDQLVSEFIEFGTKAVLLTGAQRGGDFLNNQLRGQWAERVVLSMSIDQLRLVPFGPSGAAMPGEQDHRRVIMTYKEIQLLEGKRPDLLAFDEDTWNRLSDAERNRIGEWPNRRLEPADDVIVRQARCGIEVKNSTWQYAMRRQVTVAPLSITVKEEERAHLTAWSNRTGVRLVFVQVLFDEIYCVSFARMEEALKRGHLYQSGDYVRDVQKGRGKNAHSKTYHKFHLADRRHLCGAATFPDRSVAVVRPLPNGSVVPYIRFEPAEARDVNSAVVASEIAYVTPPPPPTRRSRRP